MNNKISVKKFWQMGGKVELEIYSEIARLVGEPYFYIAGDKESFKKIWQKVSGIAFEIKGKINIKDAYQIVRGMHVGVNGITYQAEGGNLVDILRRETDRLGLNYYLIACGKYYRGLG